MSAMDQKAYLKKYLGGPSGDKKKKKKKSVKGKGFKIIDDDLDLSKLRSLDGDELDILDQGEDGPQIAGIIDERPEELKKLEQFKTSSKWRVVTQDDGFNSKVQIEEIKRDIKETKKENELIFGKMYSDSEDEKDKKNDSDLSPPRKQSNDNKTNGSSSRKYNSDSDFSPPRRKNNKESPRRQESKNYDSDLSPPRKNDTKPKDKERVRKPSRWGNADENNLKHQSSRSNDLSPAKKRKVHDKTITDSRKRSVSSDISPPRKPHKYNQNDDSDLSPTRKSRKRYRSPNSDLSPRRKRKSSLSQKYDMPKSEQSKKRRNSPDSDMSPPRRNKKQDSHSPMKYRRSPNRINNKRKYNNDSDLSLQRERHAQRRDKRNNGRSSNSPPPSNKKMARTLEGKMAGLQDARQLKEENEAFRKREDEAFKRMGDEVSGRNAHAVSRKSKKETSEEKQKQKEKAERQKELDEKYKKWSKGLKQIEAQEARIQEFIHEASKPLARHKDDRDLEDRLKDVERDGDPMLKYIKEKKRERGELPPEKPSYKGNFPPNRFNIRPGYRWDGVDRSNGYEKKYFDHQSKRKAQEEEAYKWSTEDL